MDRDTFQRNLNGRFLQAKAMMLSMICEGAVQRDIEAQDPDRMSLIQDITNIGFRAAMPAYDDLVRNLRQTLRSINPSFPGSSRQTRLVVEDFNNRVQQLLVRRTDDVLALLHCSRLIQPHEASYLYQGVPDAERGDELVKMLHDVMPAAALIDTVSTLHQAYREADLGATIDPQRAPRLAQRVAEIRKLKWPGLAAQALMEAVPGSQPLVWPVVPLRRETDPVEQRHNELEVAMQPDIARFAAAGFSFVKFLGVGGHGAAVLFKYDDGNGNTENIVAKMELAPDNRNPNMKSVIETEKDALQDLKGHMHLIQGPSLLDLRRAADRSPDLIARIKAIEDSKTIVVTEFMRHGDLVSLIAKLNHEKIDLNSKILWHIFKCLFKGCVAMAWPEDETVPTDGTDVSEEVKDRDNSVEEAIAAIDSTSPGYVHFDIDPQNILIGDFDDQEHEMVPVFKLADFGLAKKDLDRADLSSSWNLRRCGKLEFWAPEQIAREWNHIYEAPFWEKMNEPDPEITLYDTAGNYGRFTNLYQCALVMHCLITKMRLRCPPKLEQYLDPQLNELFYTYGNELMGAQYDHVDLDLRILLRRCLNHSPYTRPAFSDIEHMINCKTAPGRWDNEQNTEQTREFFQSLFCNPPSPAPTPATAPVPAPAPAPSPTEATIPTISTLLSTAPVPAPAPAPAAPPLALVASGHNGPEQQTNRRPVSAPPGISPGFHIATAGAARCKSLNALGQNVTQGNRAQDAAPLAGNVPNTAPRRSSGPGHRPTTVGGTPRPRSPGAARNAPRMKRLANAIARHFPRRPPPRASPSPQLQGSNGAGAQAQAQPPAGPPKSYSAWFRSFSAPRPSRGRRRRRVGTKLRVAWDKLIEKFSRL